jgi:hypothetical protein
VLFTQIEEYQQFKTQNRIEHFIKERGGNCNNLFKYGRSCRDLTTQKVFDKVICHRLSGTVVIMEI